MSVVGKTGLNIKKLKCLQNKAHLSVLKMFPKYYSGLPKQTKPNQTKAKKVSAFYFNVRERKSCLGYMILTEAAVLSIFIYF